MLALAAVAYAIYRYRVTRLLELERMRTRIAADLHDDIGANLTKISILSEVAHRLMAIEASQRFAWPFTGIAYRLQKHPAQVRQLTEFRRAIQEVGRYGVRVLVITADRIDAAAEVSQQHGLLSNDALIVAVMQQHGLIDLAGNDADFDCVPGITRYGPV